MENVTVLGEDVIVKDELYLNPKSTEICLAVNIVFSLRWHQLSNML